MNSRASWPIISSIDGIAVNRVLPPLVSLLLVILIGWQIARVIWMLMPGSAVGVAVTLPDTLPQASSGTRTSLDVAEIANSHIFGIADAESERPALIVEPDDDLGHQLGGRDATPEKGRGLQEERGVAGRHALLAFR